MAMVDVFVPHGHCSKTFWPQSQNNQQNVNIESDVQKQPFSVYHLEKPHNIQLRYGHLGASPATRANATSSMQLVLKVLQPAINFDLVEVLRKYILVFREAAENISENMSREPFKSAGQKVIVDDLISMACQDALEHAKSVFGQKETSPKTNESVSRKPTDAMRLSSFQRPLASNTTGKRRAESPDFPWERRLKAQSRDTMRRSLSPVPKKRPRNTTPIVGYRSHGSPHRNPKDSVRKKIEESWRPSRLTVETEFVMGTKANRALGLGATRGRIYMKHPDLFKYAGDHEDKKWMVKHNCMAATGGKNTFIMIAEDVFHLFNTEYKDSPGTMPEELQFFKLPEFVLLKMRSAMINEKRVRLGKFPDRMGTAVASTTEKKTSPTKPSKLTGPISYQRHDPSRGRLRDNTPEVSKSDESGSESASELAKQSDDSSVYEETD